MNAAVGKVAEPLDLGFDGRKIVFFFHVDSQRQITGRDRANSAGEPRRRDPIDIAVLARNDAHLGIGNAIAAQKFVDRQGVQLSVPTDVGSTSEALIFSRFIFSHSVLRLMPNSSAVFDTLPLARPMAR